MRGRALVVDDEPQMLVAMDAALRRSGWNVVTAASADEALARLHEEDFSVIFTDVRMPRRDGMELLGEVRSVAAEVPVVLMTAYGSIPHAVQAMRGGAADYLVKPFEAEDIQRVLARVMFSNGASRREGGSEFITRSPRVRQLLAAARKAAESTTTVLVVGESGTGKELLAQLIHRTSPRAARPFVAVNCAAIPETLLESELFGHEKGAFTGALSRRAGKFELASGGTLLLDEIGDMALGLQAKLLRVLQERVVDRVGGREPVAVDLRVIATTNVDLGRAVKENRFRADLYYRLNVVSLHIPPLRERREDIPPLAEQLCESLGAGRFRLAPEALARLAVHDWPGNVRELRNVIERAVTLSPREEIEASDLALEDASPTPTPVGQELGGTVDTMEKALILRTLDETAGNRTRAAEKLGISIRTLRNKLSRYRNEGLIEPAEAGAGGALPDGDAHTD
jgi:DNA-binding NtrC family response regulator